MIRLSVDFEDDEARGIKELERLSRILIGKLGPIHRFDITEKRKPGRPPGGLRLAERFLLEEGGWRTLEQVAEATGQPGPRAERSLKRSIEEGSVRSKMKDGVRQYKKATVKD